MSSRFPHPLAWFAVLALAACSDSVSPVAPDPDPVLGRAADANLALVTIDVDGTARRLWPFASADLASPHDPINVVFANRADPRNIRRALLALDGSRGAPFPPVAPFDCTWSDAIGGLMAGYGEESQWAGGAIQLQCGDYGPIRFHLRLFDLGDYTAGNAHFEVVIPGTADHQVLSWELAEQLVTYDLARTGLLSVAPSATGSITPAPTHRSIPAPIYNGLPAALQALIGGPPTSANDVGIGNDGHATILSLGREAPSVAPGTSQEFTLTYDQVIPKPFCAAGPADFLLVQGPVSLKHEVTVGGEFRMSLQVRGEFSVIPIDVTTGQPVGNSLRAVVTEWQRSRVEGSKGAIRGAIEQILLPNEAPGAGRLQIAIDVGSDRRPRYDREEKCAGT